MRAELHQVFAALGDPARVGIVGLLRQRALRSSDIAAALGEGRPATSRHIQLLRRAGLVEEAPHGDDARERVYTLRKAPFREAMGWLEELEAFWTDQLTAFQQHVDAKARPAPAAMQPRATRRRAGASSASTARAATTAKPEAATAAEGADAATTKRTAPTKRAQAKKATVPRGAKGDVGARRRRKASRA